MSYESWLTAIRKPSARHWLLGRFGGERAVLLMLRMCSIIVGSGGDGNNPIATQTGVMVAIDEPVRVYPGRELEQQWECGRFCPESEQLPR